MKIVIEISEEAINKTYQLLYNFFRNEPTEIDELKRTVESMLVQEEPIEIPQDIFHQGLTDAEVEQLMTSLAMLTIGVHHPKPIK